MWPFRSDRASMHFPRSRARLVLVVSLPLIFAYLILFRPPIPFYALLLAPIALAAMSYEFTGGTFVALVAMAGVALLIALDPNAVRSTQTQSGERRHCKNHGPS
jgi:integral membrane sensor domain MASE1